jgi:branched-chain amino acid transport system ATP-binding protein
VNPSLLSVSGLAVSFNGLSVLEDVNFSVMPGEIFGVIGPNGAGKTTLFNCISGVVRPSAGTVTLAGTPLGATPIHRRSHLGVARTFQNLNLFSGLTVLENVMVPVEVRERRGLLTDALRGPRSRFAAQRAVERARGLLHLLGLSEHAATPAGDLPVGLQRRVDIARALATRPRLLLLDEPASGLDAHETADLGRRLPILRERLDTTIVLVDHDMGLVLSVCDRVAALDFGRIVTVGTPAEVRTHPEVVASYLGTTVSAQR